MSKYKDSYFFENFIECAGIACNAARSLKNILADFDSSKVEKQLEELHLLEHSGDIKKHELTAAVVKAFITPIERDDIIRLSQAVDDVTDSIEDILIHFYITGIKQLRPDTLAFCDTVIQMCDKMKEMLGEFQNFRKSKTLSSLIIELNHLEEEGDRQYLAGLRTLYATGDALHIIAWDKIYNYFERSCDACEDVADIVESITIENN